MTLEIVESGFLTTVQDRGRWGYQRYGMPVSGPMDMFAHSAANRLVGNHVGAASIELCTGGLTLAAREGCLIAVCGKGVELYVGEWHLPLWMSIVVHKDWEIRLAGYGEGGWAYLAAAGGFEVRSVMGSKSTYLTGGIGGVNGQQLEAGTVLPTGSYQPGVFELAGNLLLPENRPRYSLDCTVEVIEGPHIDHFTDEGIHAFLNSTYAVSSVSDRMGYRLEGAAVEHKGGADVISSGMVYGSVQVPENGQPIIMMRDHPTTGGYTRIATIARADMPLVAHCMPGAGRVSFQETTVEQAQVRYRDMMGGIDEGIVKADEYDN